MKQILAIEWLKIKSYRTFWVITLMYLALLLIWNLGISLGIFKFLANGMNLLGLMSTFSGIWTTLCNYASYFVLFPSILIIINITNEYQFRTNRQNVIDGWTRLQFLHAKWGLIFTFAIIATIFSFIVGITMGIMSGASFLYFTSNLERILYLFVLTLNYFGFSLLISVIFKRSGLAIGILLLYCMVIENMLHLFFFFKLQNGWLDLILPLQASDELLPSSNVEMMVLTGKFGNLPAHGVYVLASIAWISLYYLISRQRLIRSDW